MIRYNGAHGLLFLWTCLFPLPTHGFVASSYYFGRSCTTTPVLHNQRGSNDYEWDNEKWKLSKPSYADNFLKKLHDQTQDEYQLITNSLSVYNEQLQAEQQDIQEWKDAFDRNGFSDFCPPMNVGLNCLMVGEGSDVFRKDETSVVPTPKQDVPNQSLPWEDEPGAAVTSLEVLAPDLTIGTNDTMDQAAVVPVSSAGSSSLQPEWRTRLSKRQSQGDDDDAPQDDDDSFLNTADPARRAAVYDCIVDQGLLGSVLALEDAETRDRVARELLLEAATAIREHGIYVLISPPLPPLVQAFLVKESVTAGLEWQFALDGISDSQQVVSVARRYNTGKMPKVGRLSRYQP